MMEASQATSSYVIPQSGFIGVRGLTRDLTSDRLVIAGEA